MSFYKIIEGLKNVQCNKSAWLYSWENHVCQNRPHLILSKDNRLISSISKLIKNGIFYIYKQNPFFVKHNTNIIPIFSIDSLEQSQKFGLIILDTNFHVDTKNMLKIFDEFIDNKTVFFSPKIINFEGYENRIINGLLEYCNSKGMKIKWLAHNGDVQLYEIRDVGYNQGATFSLIKLFC